MESKRVFLGAEEMEGNVFFIPDDPRCHAPVAESGGPPVTYESLVDSYLSQTHRDHPGKGCPLSALACDIARGTRQGSNRAFGE